MMAFQSDMQVSWKQRIHIYLHCKPSEFPFGALEIQDSWFEINTNFTMIIPKYDHKCVTG